MQEALTLFDSICNSRWFVKTSIVRPSLSLPSSSHTNLTPPKILFLNKIDLFAEKLPRSPLGDYFPDYTGGDNYDAACDYLLHRFVSLNQSAATKQIYAHYTCATDTQQIKCTSPLFLFFTFSDGDEWNSCVECDPRYITSAPFTRMWAAVKLSRPSFCSLRLVLPPCSACFSFFPDFLNALPQPPAIMIPIPLPQAVVRHRMTGLNSRVFFVSNTNHIHPCRTPELASWSPLPPFYLNNPFTYVRSFTIPIFEYHIFFPFNSFLCWCLQPTTLSLFLLSALLQV